MIAQVPTPSVDRIRLIDEFGELDRQVQQFTPTKNRHEHLKKLIKSWYEDDAPEAVGVIHGKLYDIQVGAKEIDRSWISLPKVVKAVGGMKEFLRICSVAIGAVEAEIGKPKTAALLVESQTGTRRIKAVAKTATVITRQSEAA